MKLAISVVFALLSGVFVYLTFRGGYFSKTDSVALVKKGYSSQEIIGQILAFDLRDYSGNKLDVNKSDITSSKKTVIHLWASWCGPCVGEVPELIEFAKNNKDVVFIIVSLDDYQEDIEKFMKSFPEFNSVRFTKVWDRDKSISKFLDADRLPMSVIISSEKSEPQLLKAVVDWKRIKI
jgi:thiol-disulfide isomerase/thioredoxin